MAWWLAFDNWSVVSLALTQSRTQIIGMGLVVKLQKVGMGLVGKLQILQQLLNQKSVDIKV